MPNEDFRAEQAERREYGLNARHEQRLENATYTAAEVKVLTEEACKVAAEAGRRIGRAEVLEERCRCFAGAEHTIGDHLGWTGASPQPSPDATSGRTDPGDPNG